MLIKSIFKGTLNLIWKILIHSQTKKETDQIYSNKTSLLYNISNLNFICGNSYIKIRLKLLTLSRMMLRAIS